MGNLFGVLGISSRALAVTQSGIRTTGHNIANVNNPAYSRQRPVLEAARPLETGEGLLGSGVEQHTVQRIADDFVQRRLLAEHSSLGSTDAQAQALAQIEEVFNEQTSDGLAASLSRLYSAFADLAASTSPGQTAEREAVRGSALSLIDTVHRMDGRLREMQRAADRSIRTLLGDVNGLAERIAELNAQIVQQEVSAPANDLRDRRDQIVRQLAEEIDVHTFEDESGALTVLVAGGATLVSGDDANSLAAAADTASPFDPTFARILLDDGTAAADVTGEIGGGELGGLLRVRDTALPSAIRSLDTVAYNLAEQVNAVHQAGVGLDGSSGDFFQAPASVEDAARGLALSANVQGSAEAIAAGLTTDPSDNRNALALAGLRDARSALFLPGDPPGPASGPTRTLLEHVSAVVSDVGLQSRTLADSRAQRVRTLELAQTRRDEISGVSLDEEVTNLMRLEAAFQANARVVSTVDRLLEEVVSLL